MSSQRDGHKPNSHKRATQHAKLSKQDNKVEIVFSIVQSDCCPTLIGIAGFEIARRESETLTIVINDNREQAPRLSPAFRNFFYWRIISFG